MAWWLWLIVGLGAGGAGGVGAMVIFNPPPNNGGEAIVEQLLAPSAALTDLDLIEPLCEPLFIASHGPLLCREMFCRMMQRGIDKASDTACEAIANINNKSAILDYCHSRHPEDDDEARDCVEIFDRRI